MEADKLPPPLMGGIQQAEIVEEDEDEDEEEEEEEEEEA